MFFCKGSGWKQVCSCASWCDVQLAQCSTHYLRHRSPVPYNHSIIMHEPHAQMNIKIVRMLQMCPSSCQTVAMIFDYGFETPGKICIFWHISGMILRHSPASTSNAYRPEGPNYNLRYWLEVTFNVILLSTTSAMNYSVVFWGGFFLCILHSLYPSHVCKHITPERVGTATPFSGVAVPTRSGHFWPSTNSPTSTKNCELQILAILWSAKNASENA